MNWNIGFYVKTVFMTILIVFLVLWGFTLYGNGYVFWGYFNYLVGCLSIYYLCWKYNQYSHNTNKGRVKE